MQTFNRCIFYPMSEEDPLAPQFKIVESMRQVDPFTSEYKIRRGVRFHSGDECTADDVKVSIEYATTPGRPRGMFPAQSTVEIVDSHTINVTTEESGIPINNALTLTHPYLCIMRAADIEAGTIEKTINGTGPYKFVGQEGENTILEANPDYFLGRPKIDRVIFSYVPDATTRVLSLLSGEAEFVERLEAEQYATLLEGGEVGLASTMSIENKYLHFRCAKKPFDDVRVRRAAAHAIDRSVILDIMGTAGTSIDNIMPRGKLGYSNLEDLMPEFNPEKCQQLLAEAGYPNGQGLPELEYITSTGFYRKTKEYGEVIQALLEAQGFPVKLTVHEPAAWNDRIYNPQEGHLVDVGWAATTPEPGIHLNLMWRNPPALITGINDEEINNAIQEQLEVPDLEGRAEVLRTKTYPLLIQKLPSFALFTSVMHHGFSKRLKSVKIYPDGSFDLTSASLS